MSASAEDFYYKVINRVVEKLKDPSLGGTITDECIHKLQADWVQKLQEKCSTAKHLGCSLSGFSSTADRSSSLLPMVYQNTYSERGHNYRAYLPSNMPPFNMQIPSHQFRGQQPEGTNISQYKKAKYDGGSGSESEEASDSESDNEDQKKDEALFKKEVKKAESPIPQIKIEIAIKEPAPATSIVGKRSVPESAVSEQLALKEEDKEEVKEKQLKAEDGKHDSEELTPGDDDDDIVDEEPQDCDMMLAEYDKVQRTKTKQVNKYKCTFKKVILKRPKGIDSIYSQITADIEY
jgi:hypothetical protein